jgi:transposase
MDAPECPGCRERDARIAALEARLQDLEAKLHDLEAKLHDALRPPPAPRGPAIQPAAPGKKKTGRRRGGQPGHPPHLRQLLPPERVSEVVLFIPDQCEHCRGSLPGQASPHDPEPRRHQVAELPEMRSRITEYQAHARRCSGCGQVTYATIPAEQRAHGMGPQLTATLSYLAGAHGMSKRAIEETAEALFAVPLSLGTVANLEKEMSAALAVPHEQARQAVEHAPVKHVDETGWKQAGRKRWLWVAATTQVAVFLVHYLRNATALAALLGESVRGILCSDRWRVYDQVPLRQRQVCWAHLKRNFEKLLELGGRAAKVGQACLDVEKQVFQLWHLFRGGGCSRETLDRRLYAPMMTMLETLQLGTRARDRRTARFCARLLGVYPALWMFAMFEGVEPTNNHGERVLRRAVLWRRRAFGCASADGCRFVERILTVVQTLRLQKRSVLEYLVEAITAHRIGRPAPRLVVEG